MSDPPRTCPEIDFEPHLQTVVNQIPHGRIATFSEVALALGDVAARRAVAEYTSRHKHDADCACHRVVRATGNLRREDAAEPTEQEQKLLAEGIEVSEGMIELTRYGFTDFHSEAPLRKLAEFQNALPPFLQLAPYPETPALVAGVDLSYPQPNRALGAYVLLETETAKQVWSVTVEREIRFPYIPGYLSFREVPVLEDLMEQVRAAGRLAEVIFVDGNGILHHRKTGIAVQLGILQKVRTIGVSKSLLCGQVDLNSMIAKEARPIWHHGECLGHALKCTEGSRPVYVSPGHLIHHEDAIRLTKLLFREHRLPEPTHQADALSKHAAKVKSPPKTLF